MPETRLSELLREKERINREIDAIRKAQREEREREIQELHEQQIGKCYKASNEMQRTKAFKIISLCENNQCAKCVCIEEKAIRIYDYPVWYKVRHTLMYFPSPLYIDNFIDIDEDHCLEIFENEYEHIRRTI